MMNKLRTLFAALVFTAIASVPAGAQELPGWQLIWADEFSQPDGSSPTSANWGFDIGGGGWGNNELQYYTSRTNNARIVDGKLVIEAKQESFGGRDYTSARLLTKNKVNYQFGRIEARIKIPRGQGIWPAFWMLGSNFDAVGWPNCGEIDIMENIGREPRTVHGTIHGPGYSGGGGIGGSYLFPSGVNVADDYRVFAIEWETNRISWFVDSNLYLTLTPANLGGRAWVFNQPFFIILNVAVGGNWPGNPDATTVFPQQMLVDYVRVYARPQCFTNHSTALPATSVASNSFAANWTAVPEATGYRLDVSTSPNFSVVGGGTTYSVNFEGVGETKTSTSTATVTLSGRTWSFNGQAVIGTTESDKKNGARAARIQRTSSSALGAMTMTQDLTTGLGNINFLYARHGTNTGQPNLVIEYSANQGANWTEIDTITSFPDQLTLFSKEVNVAGNVRVRLRVTNSGSSNRAINIDDIVMSPHVVTPSFVPGYANRPVAGTSASVTNLNSGTTYYYRVRPERAGDCVGNDSNSQSATTLGATQEQLPIIVKVDSSRPWASYMNWFTTSDAHISGGTWSMADLRAAFLPNMAGATRVLLRANTNTYNPADPFWNLPDGTSAKRLEANLYMDVGTSFGGNNVMFMGTVESNTLPAGWTAYAIIKQFGANYLYLGDTRVPLVTGTPFSITRFIPAGSICQYGFMIYGPNTAPNSSAALAGVSVVVDNCPSFTNAPTALAATAATTNSFIANWSEVYDALSYALDVASDETFSPAAYVSGYSNLVVSGTSSVVSGLAAETTYYYRVRAHRNDCATPLSNIRAAATPAPPLDPWDLDTNGDGIPDGWYLKYGLNPSDPAMADADADADGFSNREEWWLGTDPTDSESTFKVLNVAYPAGEFPQVTWLSVGGRTYSVQYADHVAGPFTQALEVTEDAVTDGEETTRTFVDDFSHTGEPPADGLRTYRIRLVVE
jgi:beta-glucanase (GH16 family)